MDKRPMMWFCIILALFLLILYMHYPELSHNGTDSVMDDSIEKSDTNQEVTKRKFPVTDKLLYRIFGLPQ